MENFLTVGCINKFAVNSHAFFKEPDYEHLVFFILNNGKIELCYRGSLFDMNNVTVKDLINNVVILHTFKFEI